MASETNIKSKIQLFFQTKPTLVYRCIFFLLSFLFLGFYLQDFLYQIGWRSYFVTNEAFRELTVHQTSGWLFYVSLFVNQIFFHPLLAALFISSLLILNQYIIEKSINANGSTLILSFLPSFLLLLIIGGAGFAIFSKFEMATFFAMIFATLWASISFFFYKRINNKHAGWSIWLINLLTIHIWGIFATIAMLMIALDQCRKKEYVMLPSTLVASLTALYFLSRSIFVEYFSHTILTPFPQPAFTNIFVFSVLTAVILLALPFADRIGLKNIKKIPSASVHAILFALCCAMTFFLSFRDVNFRAIVRLSRLTDEMQWKDAQKLAETIKHPTKGVNCYRIISLLAQGKLNDKIFDVCLPFSPSKSPYFKEATIYSADEYFYASLFNMAYLYNMDGWVELSESYRGLKNMTTIALLRNETELAKRFIRLMKEAPVLHSLASEYEKYIDDKDLMFEKYPIYEQLSKDQPHENIPQIIQNHISSFYIWYNGLKGVNVERRLLAYLYQHDIDRAIEEFVSLRERGWKEPAKRWLQEAIVLKSIQTNNLDFAKRLKIDPLLINSVLSCYKEFYKNPKMPIMEKGERMYEKYKGLYTYYYFFDNYKFNEILPYK